MSEEVILTKLEGLKELTEEKFKENEKQHVAVITQVTKTNGRVRLLEKFIWALGGAIGILGIIASGLILPTLVKVITK